MKKSILLLVVLFCVNVVAQDNVSAPMDFNIQKEVVPAVLSVVPRTLQFVDEDDNGVIDANEQCKVKFQIVNQGRGDGYGCVAQVEASGTTQGITIKDVQLPMIPAGDKYWVEIPIKASANTMTGDLSINIVVSEPNGFSTEKINSVIGTHKLKTPYVNVVSYKVLGSASGTLERRRPFNLQVIVQNTDQGVAENVRVNITFPANVSRIGGEVESVTLPQLKAGESHLFEYELIANQEASEELDIKIDLAEKQGRFAQDANIPLQFGQHIGGSIAMNVERRDQEVEIKRVSLTSEVDENIPITNKQNKNTFAVIIANEKYKNVADVPFAVNDGNIFREYCLKTLGIPDNQIHYRVNATGNDIYSEVKWLRNIFNTDKYKNAQIIFYYTGHGVPDVMRNTSYLLPIDGIATDVSTGYKLDDLYAALGALSAKSVTVFLDACFSGTTRNDGKEMLVEAKGVAIKAKSGIPQGNMVVFSAAKGDETAYPNYEEHHGMFTYYLLKKLQETKGDVTLHELGEYIRQEVHAKGAVENLPQTPCVTPSSSLDASWREWKLK